MKEFARPFYNSKAWKDCRKNYIEQRYAVDGGMCEVCRERVGYILHHKTLLTAQNISDPNITLNPALLRWECKECHDKEEGHFNSSLSQAKELLAMFDENGQPIDKRDL